MWVSSCEHFFLSSFLCSFSSFSWSSSPPISLLVILTWFSRIWRKWHDDNFQFVILDCTVTVTGRSPWHMCLHHEDDKDWMMMVETTNEEKQKQMQTDRKHEATQCNLFDQITIYSHYEGVKDWMTMMKATNEENKSKEKRETEIPNLTVMLLWSDKNTGKGIRERHAYVDPRWAELTGPGRAAKAWRKANGREKMEGEKQKEEEEE